MEKLKAAEKIMTHEPTRIEAGEVEPPPESRQEKKLDTEIKAKDEHPEA